MGPEINNIQNNLNKNSFTYEQAGITSPGPIIQAKKKVSLKYIKYHFFEKNNLKC